MTQSENVEGQQNSQGEPAPQGGETQKEQGSLQATGQSSAQAAPNINQDAELEELREKTRKGGPASTWAMAQRLTKVDHVGTPTHGSGKE